MALIDDKGRLFGKLNIIDALIILFVALFLISALSSCFKIKGPERKSIEDKVRFDIRQEEAKAFDEEMRPKRDRIASLAEMSEEMTKQEETWREGFRAGYAEGFSNGKSK